MFIFFLTSNIYIYMIVATMFIDDQKYTRDGKTYRRTLLRNSYRVNGKIRHDAYSGKIDHSFRNLPTTDSGELSTINSGGYRPVIPELPTSLGAKRRNLY